ncbi:OmpH family outer membrane protein [Mucilaginibacter sp.]|jgi:outer membrane protein|uniref:OmpH family outer membrane protein n=1 Tax=Mucilaginibacter sp. TaxID=1882438 RepID=UPI002B523166|nr:OmpH family outer membrane protein [Mucilaginibacter sp.]HTI57838.1 OmpH family outer membrane protein [Mucilaginibacter sp.]
MKKLLKVALVAVCIVFAGNIAKAQTKIGYVNFAQIIQIMPEAKTVQTQLETYGKQFQDQYTAMTTELQSKGQQYEAQRATMTDAIRSAKESELQDLQKRIQAFQTDAQQKIASRQDELSKPLIDKARAAVAQVAKEKGYTYVINSSQNDILIVSPPGDDMLADVKAKLGLK